MKNWIALMVVTGIVGCSGAPEGPAGPAGKDGAPGGMGAMGAAGVAGKDAPDAGGVEAKAPHVIYSPPVDVPVAGVTKASAKCPGAETMLSGGCMTGPGGTVTDSHPTPFADSPTYWECDATATSPTKLWVYLFCE